MTMPSLVAVIGPVEPELLSAFVSHYRGLGIDDLMLGFHFPEAATADDRDRVLTACHELVGAPRIVSDGPWHETLHGELRDRLRAMAPPGWQLIADIDEFHGYPAPLPQIVAEAEAAGSRTVRGLLLDRVSETGEIASWSPSAGLDPSFPLGGFLTGSVLLGDPRKIVLAASDVQLTLGSHLAKDEKPANEVPIPVHHFKWRAGILEDLNRRVIMHTSGAWHEVTDDVRTEAARLLAHVATRSGHIDVTDPRPRFRRVSTAEQPAGWATDAQAAILDWQYRYQLQNGRPDAFTTAS
ncbi:hypothetical protein [Actinoplanes sp. NPDC026670]|uniref:hypothetical protein n=1 Tax=Actinoplanes sp. NPDC026670 TaxID=3154700 RepID=UPI0034085737